MTAFSVPFPPSMRTLLIEITPPRARPTTPPAPIWSSEFDPVASTFTPEMTAVHDDWAAVVVPMLVLTEISLLST